MEIIVVGIITALEKRSKRKIANEKTKHIEETKVKNAFTLIVPIRDNYRFTPVLDHLRYNQPIAGLPSRKVTAIVLSYVGRRDEVCRLL